ncbi:MAG TPA: cytochrome c biogenesis protein CcdA [Candidatus Paceibacterota bacterium]|nr:cytochrome c biogenesis protein CcdA [Candidatus Paceibacterota bacterium]
MTHWFLPVIIGAAAADSINPCAFSILFLSVAFLFSLGKNRKFILAAGGLYILGIALVYMAIGIGILKVLSIFAVPNFLGKVGAAILGLYSVISLGGELIPGFPVKLKLPEKSHDALARTIHKGTMPASFILGILVGMFEFPCTGGPYLFALSLLHDKTTYWQGFGYLLVYNAIFVLPLVVILLVSTNRAVLEKVERIRKIESRKGRIIFDVVLLAIAIALIISL